MSETISEHTAVQMCMSCFWLAAGHTPLECWLLASFPWPCSHQASGFKHSGAWAGDAGPESQLLGTLQAVQGQSGWPSGTLFQNKKQLGVELRMLVCRNKQTNSNKTQSGSLGLLIALLGSVTHVSLPGASAPRNTLNSPQLLSLWQSGVLLLFVCVVTSCSQFPLPRLLSALGSCPGSVVSRQPRPRPGPHLSSCVCGLPSPWRHQGSLKNGPAVTLCLMPAPYCTWYWVVLRECILG